MTSDELTQIVVAGQRTGIVGLKQVLEEVARNFAGKPDDEIKAELMAHLSQRNYIVPKSRMPIEPLSLGSISATWANPSRKNARMRS